MLWCVRGAALPAGEAQRGSRYEAMRLRARRSLLFTALLGGLASGSGG